MCFIRRWVKPVRVLHRLGIAVDFPGGQTCCGQPAFNAGFHQPARDVARRNLSLFADAEYIIVPSGYGIYHAPSSLSERQCYGKLQGFETRP